MLTANVPIKCLLTLLYMFTLCSLLHAYLKVGCNEALSRFLGQRSLQFPKFFLDIVNAHFIVKQLNGCVGSNLAT